MSSYLQLKKRAFMSIVNGVKGFVRTVSGVPPISLEDCVDSDSLIDYKLYGNSFQDGEPSPENSIPVVSVGEYDSETGKYKIPVTARGKNLFDTYGFSANSIAKPSSTRVLENIYGTTISTTEPSSSITVTQVYNSDYAIGSTYNGYIHIGLNDDIKIGQRYIISFDIDIINNPTNATAIYLYPNGVENTNGKAVSLDGKRVYGIFTFNEHTSVKTRRTIELRICGVSFTMSNIMITPDYIEDITYEPNHAPIQTNIYLDEPLRKVGDYADYVDFGKGEVVRSAKEVEYNGSEVWGILNNMIYLHVSGMMSTEYGFSTHIVFSFEKSGNKLYFRPVSNVLRLYQNSDNIVFATVDDWKAFLTEQAEAGTPLKVTYILAEPTRTPISIPKLPTIKGTTIYEIGTSLNASNMEATYYSTVKGE